MRVDVAIVRAIRKTYRASAAIKHCGACGARRLHLMFPDRDASWRCTTCSIQTRGQSQ